MKGIEQLDSYIKQLIAEGADPEGEAESVDILVDEGCFGVDLDEVHREVLNARVRRALVTQVNEQLREIDRRKVEQVDKEGTA